MLDLGVQSITEEIILLQDTTIHDVPFASLSFAIMHGNGNVILVLDEQASALPIHNVNKAFARQLCNIFTTIKVDGIAFLRRTGDRIKMTFFDQDGTEEPMCGNGLRCSTRYAYDRGYIQASDTFLTDDGEKWVAVTDGVVQVSLGPGREFTDVSTGSYFVFSSVAHLVIIDSVIDAIDVKREGAAYRYDAELCARLKHPEGLHVNFLQPGDDHVYVRTYEVGVEDETRSCGSGAAAAGYIAQRVLGYSFPITIRTRGGDITVDQHGADLTISGLVEYICSSPRSNHE